MCGYSPRCRPALPGIVQQDEVPLTVCQEDPGVLGSNKQLLVVCAAFPPQVPSSHGGMTSRPQDLGDLEGYIVIDVEGSQWKI
jgi:hypothetical protein